MTTVTIAFDRKTLLDEGKINLRDELAAVNDVVMRLGEQSCFPEESSEQNLEFAIEARRIHDSHEVGEHCRSSSASTCGFDEEAFQLWYRCEPAPQCIAERHLGLLLTYHRA